MKKLFVMLLAVISIFAFAVGVYADAFKPADEPTMPFERIVYYTKDLAKPVLSGKGISGTTYIIGTDPMGTVIVASDDMSIVAVLKLSNEAKSAFGFEYLLMVRSIFFGMNEPLDKETAEITAHNIFAQAENDGVWFRDGYVLYWQRDLGSLGGY